MGTWLRFLNEPGARAELPANRAPTEGQRSGLEIRAANIRRWRVPASVERVEAWLSAVLGPYDGWSTETDAELSLSVYVKAVENLPGYAVEAACEAFIQARVPDIKPGRRPTPAEIASEAYRQCQALAKELHSIDRVLRAKAVEIKADPKRKAELLEIARSAVQTMPLAGQRAEAKRAGREYAIHTPETPAEALARLAAERDRPIAPLSTVPAHFHVPDMREESEG